MQTQPYLLELQQPAGQPLTAELVPQEHLQLKTPLRRHHALLPYHQQHWPASVQCQTPPMLPQVHQLLSLLDVNLRAQRFGSQLQLIAAAQPQNAELVAVVQLFVLLSQHAWLLRSLSGPVLVQ